MSDMEKRVAQYVQLRDFIEVTAKRHEEELKRPKETLQKLGSVIQKFLDENNIESVKTDGGTAYKSIRYTATVSDPDAFMRFVIGGEHFELLERRASALAVKAFVEENKELPTGVNLNALSTIGVRRPPGQPKS